MEPVATLTKNLEKRLEDSFDFGSPYNYPKEPR